MNNGWLTIGAAAACAAGLLCRAVFRGQLAPPAVRHPRPGLLPAGRRSVLCCGSSPGGARRCSARHKQADACPVHPAACMLVPCVHPAHWRTSFPCPARHLACLQAAPLDGQGDEELPAALITSLFEALTYDDLLDGGCLVLDVGGAQGQGQGGLRAVLLARLVADRCGLTWRVVSACARQAMPAFAPRAARMHGAPCLPTTLPRPPAPPARPPRCLVHPAALPACAQMVRWRTRWHPRCASSARGTTLHSPSPAALATLAPTDCWPIPRPTPAAWCAAF